jgi:tetratricopeptide (TPR) repeat protein
MPHALSLLLVVAAAVVAYLNAAGGALVFDAKVIVAENPALQTWSADGVRYLFTHDYWQPMATDGLYRPLTTLSFLIDRTLLGHGDVAFGYVVENVALHALCAVLVYALVWQAARRRWAATVAALLFAVHPVTTEAVTNVVGRADLLASAGVLGGVLCWAHGRTASGRRRLLWLLGLGAAAVLALFSKESGIVLVAAVVLWDVAFPPDGRPVRARHVVVGLVLVAYLAARWWVDRIGLAPGDIAAVDNPLVEAPFLAGRLTALGVLVREAGLLLWPATLSIDYSYRQIPVVESGASDAVGLVGLVGLVLAVWALWRVRSRRPAIFFLGAFALLAILPSSNLLRLIGSIMAERFLYLPLAGVAGVVALVVDGWASTGSRRTAATVIVAVVTLALMARTAARNLDWRDDRTLWAATVQAAPESAKASKAYANALAGSATDVAALSAAIARTEQAVAIRPDYQQALVDLGSYQLRLGDAFAGQPEVAQRWYEKALTALEAARAVDEKSTARFVEKMRARGNPDDAIPAAGDAVLFNNLAIAYVKLNNADGALDAYVRLRRLQPTNGVHHRHNAALPAAGGQPDLAAVALFQANAIDDGDDAAKQRLADLYRSYPAGADPIVTTGPQGDTQIHTGNPIVRGHRCRGFRELVGIFTDARLPRLADAARSEAASCGAN